MMVAKVTGSVVSTQKDKKLVGQKLLLVELCRVDGARKSKLTGTGRTMVAVDAMGAGMDDVVLLTQGSSARMTPTTKELPIDAVVVGIVDTVSVEDAEVYSRDG